VERRRPNRLLTLAIASIESRKNRQSRSGRRRGAGFSWVCSWRRGLVAFVIAAVSLTVPEVVADKSITGDSAHTTYFGDNEDKPWGEGRNWSDCFDDIEQCLTDIIEAGR
jgi:hypothetical protein